VKLGDFSGAQVTNTSISLTVPQAVNITVSFDYAGKVSTFGTLNGKGSMTYSADVMLMKSYALPSNTTGSIVLTFKNATFVMDSGFNPQDANSAQLLSLMVTQVGTAYPFVTSDAQAALTSMYQKESWPASTSLSTSFPEIKVTLNTTWTDAPVFNNSGNKAVIYPSQGTTKPASTVRKSKGFLKMVEEAANWIVPNFNETQGKSQLSLTTDSLVYSVLKIISDSGKFTFNVTDKNKLSQEFAINADFLSRIYPGVLTAYPRDAPITVDAAVSDISLSKWDMGSAAVTFNVTDSTGKTVLLFTSFVNFVPSYNEPKVNVYAKSIQHSHTKITNSPFGFVDASTLQDWVDDAFSNYNSASWKLFEEDIDFYGIVGKVNNVTINDTTILITADWV